MALLTKGRYTVRRAVSRADMTEVYALRGRCFGAAGAVADRFDASATHLLVQEEDGGAVASFRMALLRGDQLGDSYAGMSYRLDGLKQFSGLMLELGRFCIHPAWRDPDILRVAWAALTAFVDENNVEILFGCSSFSGTDPQLYLDAFTLLKARHLGPEALMPTVKAEEVFHFDTLGGRKTDVTRGNAVMPPLLRTYLMMGGWVSDHAVIDRAMNTLHVFTALEIGSIPESRKSRLRALV